MPRHAMLLLMEFGQCAFDRWAEQGVRGHDHIERMSTFLNLAAYRKQQPRFLNATKGYMHHRFEDVAPLRIVARRPFRPSTHPKERSANQHVGSNAEPSPFLTAPNLEEEMLTSSRIHNTHAGRRLRQRTDVSVKDRLRPSATIFQTPARSEISAVIRLTVNSQPSVAPAMCNVLPTTFLPASTPPSRRGRTFPT